MSNSDIQDREGIDTSVADDRPEHRALGGYRSTRSFEGGSAGMGRGAGTRGQESNEGGYSSRRSEYDRGDGAGRGDRGERTRTIKKQQVFRKRTCPFCPSGAVKIDYKDVDTLSRFLSDRGKILPSRVTSVCLKDQRELALAVKRARFLALLPYVND
jgi:small subunit ribosomal protein S18